MELFYAPGIPDGILQLDEKESRHCITVLRHKVGDTINVLDGKGGIYTAEITAAGKSGCHFEINETSKAENNLVREIHIAIAPPKNAARFEWFLEKAVEIGVSSITPLLTERGTRKKGKKERWEKIVISAMKQSKRAWLPELREWMDFRQVAEECTGQVYIAHCLEEDKRVALTDLIKDREPVHVLIGPEGDFTRDEIEYAIQNGVTTTSLGSARLRTETAAVAAVVMLNLA